MRAMVAAMVALALAQSSNNVTGVVDNAVTRQPVADARVLLARVDGPLTSSIASVADDRGRFAIRDVAAGTYRVFATRDGYLRGEASVPVAIAAGQPIPAVSISLTPTAVISGRVVSEFGDPVPNAYVRASVGSDLALTYAGAYVNARSDPTQRRVIAETKTNDLGEYRLFDLGPGAYVISAERYTAPYIENERYMTPTPPCPDCMGEGAFLSSLSQVFSSGAFIDPRALAREPSRVVFYPGTSDRNSASPIEVHAGAEISGIDLRLSAKAP